MPKSGDQPHPASGISARTVLNRTQLVDATIRTVATTSRRCAAGHCRAVPAAGQFSRGGDHCLRHSRDDADHRNRHAQGKLRRQSNEPGALDFGLIVDGAVIIAEIACAISPSGNANSDGS